MQDVVEDHGVEPPSVQRISLMMLESAAVRNPYLNIMQAVLYNVDCRVYTGKVYEAAYSTQHRYPPAETAGSRLIILPASGRPWELLQI